MNRLPGSILSILLVGTLATPTTAQDARSLGDDLGIVHPPASCEGVAQAHLENGLALLHHMTYDYAEQEFMAATRADPACALGYWGQAMTYIHPLWSDPPNAEKFAQGSVLLKTALAVDGITEIERSYIEATSAYFEPGRGAAEKPNLVKLAAAWEAVHEQYPDDPEAALFFAMSNLVNADPTDATHATVIRSGSIAEEVLAKWPRHPGAFHYAIHAYDHPALAARADDVAARYGDIAPNIAHALHMPSHIFIRIGSWDQSIAWNLRSADAAFTHRVNGVLSMHYLHALDYLAYAYLQVGDDTKASEIQTKIDALDETPLPELPNAYTIAAVPARLTLERQRWEDAAALEVRAPADFDWDKFPAAEAMTHFARAIGAARSNDFEAARMSTSALAELQSKAAVSSDYWAKQIAIQHDAAVAWTTFAQGDTDEGLRLMQAATDLAATTEKHPVTPGEVIPTRELYADMLLEAGRYAEAETQYILTLERSPNRLNSLFGAGFAAERGGNTESAAIHYTDLSRFVTATEPVVDRIAHARDFVAALRN